MTKGTQLANAVTQWDPRDPLAHTEPETPNSNIALHDYALLGATRSLRKLCDKYEEHQERLNGGERGIPEPPTLSYNTICDWSRRYNWQKRVLQWEMLQRAEEAQRWEERRIQVREDDWSHATQLREIAQRIIDAAPAFINRTRKVVDEGTPQINNLEGEMVRAGRPREVVVTVALDIGALEKIEKMASRLARLAAEMDESRSRLTVVDWRKEAEDVGLDTTEIFERFVESVVADFGSGSEPTDR